MRRDHVTSTLIQRHFDVVCLLGAYSSYSFILLTLKLCRLFVIVYRCVCGFSIIVNFISVTFFDFWTKPFLGLKYYQSALPWVPCMCNSYRYQSKWDFAGPFGMWFWHFHQLNFCHFFQLLNLPILVLKYYGECMCKGKHYKHIF